MQWIKGKYQYVYTSASQVFDILEHSILMFMLECYGIQKMIIFIWKL